PPEAAGLPRMRDVGWDGRDLGPGTGKLGRRGEGPSGQGQPRTGWGGRLGAIRWWVLERLAGLELLGLLWGCSGAALLLELLLLDRTGLAMVGLARGSSPSCAELGRELWGRTRVNG